MSAASSCIVVPCYNEADRLDRGEFRRLAADGKQSVLFVDDGSTDSTFAVVSGLAEEMPDRIGAHRLERNSGKGEAVRQGLLAALETDASNVVGFLDADLATPVTEAVRLIERLEESGHDAIVGSRIAHLGSSVERKLSRHLAGRMFAAAASLALDEMVYDTQCGAKFFRDSPLLREALAEPFSSRWAFDVELLGRLLERGASVVEEPLLHWTDVPGSKLGLTQMAAAGLDVLQIWAKMRLSRRRQGR